MTTTAAPHAIPEATRRLPRAAHRIGPSSVSRWATALRASAARSAVSLPVLPGLASPARETTRSVTRSARRPRLLRNVVGSEVLAVTTMLLMLVAAALV